MEKVDVASRTAELAERLLASLGIELVEIEYKREGRDTVLRLYVDKEGGHYMRSGTWITRSCRELRWLNESLTEKKSGRSTARCDSLMAKVIVDSSSTRKFIG